MAGKRNRMHTVTPPTSGKDQMRIVIDKETLMTMDRAARRQAAIDDGMLIPGGVRAAVHGGTKHELAKRKRREGRQSARNYQQDGE